LADSFTFAFPVGGYVYKGWDTEKKWPKEVMAGG
jgi:hypothetical protein